MIETENQSSASTDVDELAKFEKMAEDWWNLDGDFKPLHKLNPTRVAYVRDAIKQHFMIEGDDQPLKGYAILDVGCGGGLLCEPLRRLGAEVWGIDAVGKNIEIAKIHAGQMDLDINYRAISVEALGDELAKTGKKFDAVTALEIIEHVADPDAFVASCAKLMKPEGLIFFSTLNRTLKSYAMGIVAAEYILGWLPKGTHDWDKFVKPHELKRWVSRAGRSLGLHGLEVTDTAGFDYNPLQDTWSIGNDLAVNYITTSKCI
ncbi:MAG: bifunctional 2-polyprenyl-6-hydroxyphenol methylase/3-demethylubiquinol 3-O-methyltransferase UbiG [Alphaproteobacteria bacterium]